jgi:epoxyqueuosine reductase
MGNWIFGCDVCQDICPFQRFAQPTKELAFFPVDTDRAAPPLLELLTLNEAVFKTRFQNTPIERIKRERLVRNACIAVGNWGHAGAIPPLKRLLNDTSSLVREHAAWALAQIEV